MGERGVGKTSFMYRIGRREVFESHHSIGADFMLRQVDINDTQALHDDWYANDLVARGLEHMKLEQRPTSISVKFMAWDNHDARWRRALSRAYYRYAPHSSFHGIEVNLS
jgi:GTPase SAR1 family protein